MSIEKVSTVQTIYEAFGRQDLAAIMVRVTPDTVWDFNGGRPGNRLGIADPTSWSTFTSSTPFAPPDEGWQWTNCIGGP